MSSLTDLNNFANETVEFEDQRDPAVVFNIFNDATTFESTTLETVFAVIFPLDILEIDNVTQANVRFRLNVPSDYTVDFGTLAPGLSLNITGGNHIISGISSAADWQSIKGVTVSLPNLFEGEAVYTATVLFNNIEGPQTVTWNVGVFRPQVLMAAEFNLNSTPVNIINTKSFMFVTSELVTEAIRTSFVDDMTVNSGLVCTVNTFTQSLSIPVEDIPYGMNEFIGPLSSMGLNPTVSSDFDPTWTLTIQTSNFNALFEISDQFLDIGFEFNSQTKTATLIGNTAKINNLLGTLFIHFGQSEQPFDLIYTLDNDTLPGSLPTVQSFIPISQGFLLPRTFNNSVDDPFSANPAESNIFDGTAVVLSNLDPAESYNLALSVPVGELRFATNISPLVYSSRSPSITISGTPAFINSRLQSNRVQFITSVDILEDVELTVTLSDNTRAYIQATVLTLETNSVVRPLKFNFTDVGSTADGSILIDTGETDNQDFSVIKRVNLLSPDVFNVLVFANPATRVDLFTTTSTEGTSVFNSISRTLTLTGTVEQLSDQLSKLQIKPSTTQGDYTVGFQLTENIGGNLIDQRTLSVRNIKYPTFTSFNFRAGPAFSGGTTPSTSGSTNHLPRTKTQLYHTYNSNTFPWINDDLFLSVNAGIYTWRVPKTGNYRITAFGASRAGGGNDDRAALISGTFSLQKNELIDILAGVIGDLTATSANLGITGRPGMGGTFVVKKNPNGISTDSDICVIAGGAGGIGFPSGVTGEGTFLPRRTSAPKPGVVGTNIPSGERAVTAEGGDISLTFTDALGGTTTHRAIGGGGFNNFLNGGVGTRIFSNNGFSVGGFGGGGAAAGPSTNESLRNSNGGGGGYRGGGAAIILRSTGGGGTGSAGGGGSSFNNGSNQSNSLAGQQSWNPLITESGIIRNLQFNGAVRIQKL